jgi:hypothetical protein
MADKPLKQKILKAAGNNDFILIQRTTSEIEEKDEKTGVKTKRLSVTDIQTGAGVLVNPNIFAPKGEELTLKQQSDLQARGECVLETYE